MMTPQEIRIEAGEKQLAKYLKKNFCATATLYLAQHDDLVAREPEQVERLVITLLNAKMLDDLKFVMEIVLDK